METDPKHILLSRTDSIGDVILTLPVAGYLKQKFPRTRISFIGNTYTQAVVRLSGHIDCFINWDELKQKSRAEQVAAFQGMHADWIIHIFPNREIAGLTRKAGIPNRAGTSHRFFHWWTCNRKIHFSRRRSELHEAQLNFKLLSPLGIHDIPALSGIHPYFGFSNLPVPSEKIRSLIDPHRFNLILHPKSQGSAREWGVSNFEKLVKLLPAVRFKIFITGTRAEGEQMKDFLGRIHSKATDLTGKFDLNQLIAFISITDGLVAASTGPLHIAAALGKKAVGLFAPMKPIHPGRWAPLGKDVHILVKDQYCEDCRDSADCECIRSISPEKVSTILHQNAE
ncbi:MAG: glycosyl transferase family 9 [Desulfobacterium sp.]|nr:glycosyl transferase family 9 [Desulfobacterium sp.]